MDLAGRMGRVAGIRTGFQHLRRPVYLGVGRSGMGAGHPGMAVVGRKWEGGGMPGLRAALGRREGELANWKLCRGWR